jgi:uncharacterized membrane protein
VKERRSPMATQPIYLVAIAYEDEFRADEARIIVKRAQREGVSDIVETAVIAYGPDGKKRLTQDVDLEGKRRTQGHWLGIAAALVTGIPPLIFVGTAAGEVIGMLTDTGIRTGELRQVGRELKPGSSALFILAHEAERRGALLERLRPLGGRVVRTTLPGDLADALDRMLQEPVHA